MLSRSIHNEFLPSIQHGLTEPGPASATEFLFGASDAKVDGLVKTNLPAHPTQFLEDVPQESLKGWRERPHPPQLGEIRDLRIEESGILPASLGEHGVGILKALKTTVLLTGGLCSKLFGIGLMGYLAFQSMQANVSRSRQEQAQGQYVYK
mmetsp:Transcript_16979/g.20240  ORF Transcript_16979/g.20240 Transcript_16979/m.20240 type:complete len:151 (+) Transcript_16979:113-565(+)